MARLIGRINEASPFGDIRALIWMSHQDQIISNPMSSALATKFKLPSIVVDDRGGFHVVPDESKVGVGMGFDLICRGTGHGDCCMDGRSVAGVCLRVCVCVCVCLKLIMHCWSVAVCR